MFIHGYKRCKVVHVQFLFFYILIVIDSRQISFGLSGCDQLMLGVFLMSVTSSNLQFADV